MCGDLGIPYHRVVSNTLRISFGGFSVHQVMVFLVDSSHFVPLCKDWSSKESFLEDLSHHGVYFLHKVEEDLVLVWICW